MAGKLNCRVCGKEYEGCRSAKTDPTLFRWQDVACCPEHGEEYLRRVLESRGQAPEKKQDKEVKTSKAPASVIEPKEDEVSEVKYEAKRYSKKFVDNSQNAD